MKKKKMFPKLGLLITIIIVVLHACSVPKGKSEDACYEGNGIAIFLGSFFPYNTSINLIIDDGEYSLEEYLILGLERDDLTCLTNYVADKDSIKIYLSIDKRDTVVYLNPSVHRRVFIGTNLSRDPIVSTDSEYWKRL